MAKSKRQRMAQVARIIDKDLNTRGQRVAFINDRRWAHYTDAVHYCYVNAEKRADRLKVADKLEELIKGDSFLDRETMAYASDYPLHLQSIDSPSSLQNKGTQNIRQVVRDTKLEDSLTLLSPEELQKMMYEGLVVDHGEEPLPVNDPGTPHLPKSRWPYLRLIKHMLPSDIRAAMQTREQMQRDLQRSTSELAILDRAAQKANPDAYRRNLAIEVIFRLSKA
jgi:hypothetical protein